MDKKRVIIILLIIFLIFVIVMKVKTKKDNKFDEQEISYNVLENVKVDELSGEYIIYDESGEEKARAKSEGEIKAYMDNPNYNPED